ncbi:MAG: MdtA/MuxA family multidrug efflux RND transporter periplasmic adaptor subunit [Candidatus Magnetominusculus sp. LBB02]|nr:MdtA/MuxA family multidrug efflux RND transporter periplasmic adaptor subunit [Candidatus Magnetominusculus sp. LBB02]
MANSRKPVRTWYKLIFAVLPCSLFIAAIAFGAEQGRPDALKPPDKSGDKTAIKQSGKPGFAPAAFPVEVAKARTGDMGSYLNGLGTVVPLNTVSVKSRVDGELMRVMFEEGQAVKKGDVIAIIDPRPFEIQLAQAEGQLAKDMALLDNARLDADRYRTLLQQDSISKQQLDTQQSLVKQYEAAVKADRAQVENAKLQIVYSRLTAPVSGRIGLRQIDPGNIVHAADSTAIAVITQIKPISVVFPIAEDHLPGVLEKLKKGVHLQVEAYDRQRSVKLATGRLLTIDNQIDPNTGTVRFKAIFNNEDEKLFPNQFVNAVMLLELRSGVVIVPSSAVQQTQKGTFVYVLTEDGKAAVRPVKAGQVQKDTTSIESGLSVGDQVITAGAERLVDGAKVQVKSPSDNSTRAKAASDNATAR